MTQSYRDAIGLIYKERIHLLSYCLAFLISIVVLFTIFVHLQPRIFLSYNSLTLTLTLTASSSLKLLR